MFPPKAPFVTVNENHIYTTGKLVFLFEYMWRGLLDTLNTFHCHARWLGFMQPTRLKEHLFSSWWHHERLNPLRYTPEEQRAPLGIWQQSSIIHALHVKSRNAQRWTNMSGCRFEVWADVISHDSALCCSALEVYMLTHKPYALFLYKKLLDGTVKQARNLLDFYNDLGQWPCCFKWSCWP